MPRLLSFPSRQRLPVVAALGMLLFMTVFGWLLFGWQPARAEPPQLAFTIESTPGAIRPNEYALLQWTGTITNSGSETANDVMVGLGPSGTLAIPYFFFVTRSVDGVGQPVSPTDLGWRIGQVAPGQTVTLEAETIVRAFGEGRYGGGARVFVGDQAIGDVEVAFDVRADAADPPTDLFISKTYTGGPPLPPPISPPDGGDGDIGPPGPWSPPTDGWPPIMPPVPVSPPDSVSPPDDVTVVPVPDDVLVDPPNTSIVVDAPLGLTPPDQLSPPEPVSPPDGGGTTFPALAPYELRIRNDSERTFTSLTIVDRYNGNVRVGSAGSGAAVDEALQTITWDLASLGEEALQPGEEIYLPVTFVPVNTNDCGLLQNVLVVTAGGGVTEEAYATVGASAQTGVCFQRGGGDCRECFCVGCAFVPGLPTDGTGLPASGNGNPADGSQPSAQNQPSSETAGTTQSNANAPGLPSAGAGPEGDRPSWPLAIAAGLTMAGLTLAGAGLRFRRRRTS